MRLDLFLLLKMTIGFIVGMLLAMLFKLPYFYTAGVIAVLSFESTRKASIQASIKRLLASVLSLGLASLLFYVFSFEVWVLFLFVLLFIPLTFAINISKGIIVSLVLVSQIFLEKDISYALNATYILLIGIGVAYLLNLYMPKNPYIKRDVDAIDQSINQLIQDIAYMNVVSFIKIDAKLKQVYQQIQIEIENINLPELTKRLKYIEMRKEQVSILKRIHKILLSIDMMKEKQIILDFLKSFDHKIGEDNYAKELDVKLQELFYYFKQTDLPENRDLFEKRAQLYYVLLEIDQFLNLKLMYHDTVEKTS